MNIIKEFQEDYSAKNFNRPEWKKLNDFAKKIRRILIRKVPMPSGRPGTNKPSDIGVPDLEIILYENPLGRSRYPLGSGCRVTPFLSFSLRGLRVQLDSEHQSQ
ncbi:MAG: hypothetical protein ACPH6A_05645 [Flavobacteriaceae bacterium]